MSGVCHACASLSTWPSSQHSVQSRQHEASRQALGSHVGTCFHSSSLSTMQPQRPSTRTLPSLARPSPRTLARLPREVLLLHLNSRDLSVNGSRQQLVARLRKAYCQDRSPRTRGDNAGATSRIGHATPLAGGTSARARSRSPVRSRPSQPGTPARGHSHSPRRTGPPARAHPPQSRHHQPGSQRSRLPTPSTSSDPDTGPTLRPGQRSHWSRVTSQRRRHISSSSSSGSTEVCSPIAQSTSQRRRRASSSSSTEDTVPQQRSQRSHQPRSSQRRKHPRRRVSTSDSASGSKHASGHSSDEGSFSPRRRSKSSRRSRRSRADTKQGRSLHRHSTGRRHRHHRTHKSTSPSGASSASDSRDESDSSSSSTSASRCRTRHRRRRRQSTHHPHRHHWPSGTSASSISCAPPVPSRFRRKIRRGEYVDFNNLLLPTHTPPLFQPLAKEKHKRKESKRVMTDLATWLESWNRFLCCHLSYFPITALEMAKYQTLLVMLFAHHPPQHCLEYDRLFRQTTAQDPSLRWDTIKEDIYVWTITKKGQSFRDKPSIMSRLGPPASDASNRAQTKPTNRETHTRSGKEICKRYNLGRCTLGDQCVFAHACWQPGCHETHPGRGCSKQ